MSFLPPWGADLAIGIAAVGTAAVAIGLFMRSTRSRKEKGGAPTPSVSEPALKQADSLEPPAAISLKVADVERARKTLRLLALERDALSMVIAKFFEAEDEGEISKEDRAKLSKDYEERVKLLSDKVRQAELIVGLYELERIREEIVKRFDAKLSETNAKIEELRKELKLEAPIKEEKKIPVTRKEKEKTPEEGREGEEKKEEEEEKAKQKGKPKRSEIEERIEKLREEVLKELEELEKLEIDI